MMRRYVSMLLFCLGTAGAFGLQRSSGVAASAGQLQLGLIYPSNRPANDVPRDLREFWLRFHETDLCQGIDAAFAFNSSGVEIWCLVEDERSYHKLADMAARLRSRWRVDLYVTKLPPESQSPEDREPPPSLWNNQELHDYLGDPSTRIVRNSGSADNSMSDVHAFGERLLKQRVRMYAVQVLEWQKKLQRYATDIQLLAPAAFGAGTPADLRARAAAACLAHAQGMSRNAEKLEESLARALPPIPRKTPPGIESVKIQPACSPLYCAYQLSIMGLGDARLVYRFVYPRKHAVDISDLRDPSILESLRFLRKRVSDFERAIRSGSLSARDGDLHSGAPGSYVR